MKAIELSSILKTYADTLESCGAGEAGARLHLFSSALDKNPQVKIADFIKNAAAADGYEIGSPSLGDIYLLLFGLDKVLHPIAKNAILVDIKALLTFLNQHASTDLVAFVVAVSQPAPVATKSKSRFPSPGKSKTVVDRDNLVATYVERLSKHVGDDMEFKSLLEELQNDGNLRLSELKAITSQFSFVSPKSKADAYKKIWSRHQELMNSRAKAKATAGRSAA